MRSKILYFTLSSILILISINFSGCNALENATTSGSKLILELITGTDLTGRTGSTTIFSDVIKNDGSIINDSATAQMSAMLLDPAQPAGTFYQTIIVDRIHIEYSRSDGLSVQGRDVPYSFSQDVSVAIDIGSTAQFGFVLVQHTAKLESPLIDLRYSGEILKMEAKVTFFGKDIGGQRVQPVLGSVSIWFANFADN